MAPKYAGLIREKILKKVHLQFYKRLIAVKHCIQNDFIYGELGRSSLQNKHYLKTIKYWLKVTNTSNC